MDAVYQPQFYGRVYNALLVGNRFCKFPCSINRTFLQTESTADYALDRIATVLFITQLGRQSQADPTAGSCLAGPVCVFPMLLLLDTPSPISFGDTPSPISIVISIVTPYASDSHPTHGVVFVILFAGRVL